MTRHLYIHIPFCRHICPYCAFYKHTPGKLANRRFVEAILEEARKRSRDYEVIPETVYFGGGTPSLLSATLLSRLLVGLHDLFDLSQCREWTIECNPGTFDRKKAELMREAGINRASLGIQSFHPRTLQTLGRDHTEDEARESFWTLREAGFDNISVDLMFSIPGQSLVDWGGDLGKAIELKPEHVSCYNLTYEEDTEFMERHVSGELDEDDSRDADLFYEAIRNLGDAGFRHYEISNYAHPGYESRHNRSYWAGEDYLGLGPGAVSTIEDLRWKTLPDTAAYTLAFEEEREVRTEIEKLGPEERRIEAIALQLRTARGISGEFFGEADQVGRFIEEGLMEKKEGRYRLTLRGKALADSIVAALV